MMFRVLKFRPLTSAQPPEPPPEQQPRAVLRPAINRDTEYFWAGTRAGGQSVRAARGGGEQASHILRMAG